MLKKIKDWIGTNLDVYKVENANDVGTGLVRHIWKGEETATQVGTTLSAQVMNDLQKGLVHTLDTIRTVGTNKDIYEVALTGIEEFGVFDGLKLLIRIDGENQFEDVFLKLGGTEYQIHQLKNSMLDKIDKGILKDKKEYLLNFKNNSFVLSDSTLYGSQKGTALEGNRLAEILGLEFGGNIQDIGNKTKGKFYYDNVTKFYYECIGDNSLTYNDSGKFRAISNKPISDKVENLHKMGNNYIEFPDGLIIQWGENYFEGLSSTPGATLDKNINFSKTFRQRCLNVQISGNYNYSDESLEAILNSSSLSKNGFTLQVMRQRGGGGDKGGFFWQAIGF
nr:MAG TPA: putative tail fiber protein [Caudoviricetes sp.]